MRAVPGLMAQSPTRRHRPELDHRVLKDPDALGVAIGELFDAEPAMQRHRRKIVRLQNRLRAIVTGEAWSTYLALETASSARLNDAIDLATAWAFRQGRRIPSRR